MNRKERAIVEVFDQVLDTIHEAKNEAIKSSKEDVLLIEERLNKIEKENDKRWEMLKKYLEVEEKEIADLEPDTSNIPLTFTFTDRDIERLPKKAVKKSKLVKRKKYVQQKKATKNGRRNQRVKGGR